VLAKRQKQREARSSSTDIRGSKWSDVSDMWSGSHLLERIVVEKASLVWRKESI